MFELTTWPRSAWSLFDELESLQEDLGHAFGGGYRRFGRGTRYPLMNVWSSNEGLVVDVEIPGIDINDLEVSTADSVLTLHGKVNTAKAGEKETWLRRERASGEFVRTVQLPYKIDENAVKAKYTNGILRLTLPQAEEEKPRKITIEQG